MDLELVIDQEKIGEGKFYAKSSPNLAKLVIYKTGFGERLGVYVTRLDDRNTQVEVVT